MDRLSSLLRGKSGGRGRHFLPWIVLFILVVFLGLAIAILVPV